MKAAKSSTQLLYRATERRRFAGRVARTATLACALLGSACGGSVSETSGASTAPSNPTGDCDLTNVSWRPENNDFEPGSRWLPDCDNVLAREHWQVFAVDADSAYVLPRPDGAPELAAVCGDAQHELRQLVDEHALCTSASSAAHVAAVNDLAPAEALRLTHYLHTQLVFRLEDDGEELNVYPSERDVTDACQLQLAAQTPRLAEACASASAARSKDRPIDPHFYGALGELVPLLNQLYGIDAAAEPR